MTLSKKLPFVSKANRLESAIQMRANQSYDKIFTQTNFYGVLFLYGLTSMKHMKGNFKIITALLKAITIISMLILLCYTFHFAFLTSKVKILFKFSFLFKSWIVLITYTVVYTKFAKIGHILEEISERLSKTQVNRLSMVSVVFFVFWLFGVVINAFVFIWLAIRSNEKYYIIIREILWAVYGFGWFTASVLLLTFICYSLHAMETKILEEFRIDLTIQLADTGTNMDPSVHTFIHVQQVFINLQRLKECVNDQLGTLPFFWFLEMFSSTCFRLTQIALEHNFDGESLYMIICFSYEYLLLCSLYLFYVFSLSYFQARRPTINTLMHWFHRMASNRQLTTRESNEKLILVEQLVHIYSNGEYMAWNVFSIDNKFIFGFLSAVVPFSVMFIQLLQQIIA